MLQKLVAVLAWALLVPVCATAQDLAAETEARDALPALSDQGRRSIGYGRLFTNDFLGDGKDRWRTGSISSSRVWADRWHGAAPAGFGELLELRLHGQIIAPANLRNPDPGDRPWAGVLSAGLHSHFQRGGMEYALGADIVMTGPQTRLDDFQDWLHDLISAPRPSDAVLSAQIPDSFRPTLVAEAGRTVALGDGLSVRPFAEARAGDETLLRLGADLTFGAAALDGLKIRESVTGQRYQAVDGEGGGLSFVLGGDVAYVSRSEYLPESRGYELASRRDRLRAGLRWQQGGTDLFYGVTYLGKEFEAQPEGQLTGSVRLRMRF
jgi:hypothetical protein